jgi:hypothetical protein
MEITEKLASDNPVFWERTDKICVWNKGVWMEREAVAVNTHSNWIVRRVGDTDGIGRRVRIGGGGMGVSVVFEIGIRVGVVVMVVEIIVSTITMEITSTLAAMSWEDMYTYKRNLCTLSISEAIV